MQTGKPIIDKGYYFVNGKGKKNSVTLSTAVLKGQQGNIIGGAETFRDISEIEVLRKQLSENLLESALFGHVIGAFTGTIENKQGDFARTTRGTLLSWFLLKLKKLHNNF